ncbi:unnamed protein product, partial [Didymodactylos carnosus]
IIYDIIVEPPSVGSTTDDYGHHKPMAFMAWRINGQYIMEGLAASFMFPLGGLGFIILDLTNKPSMPKLNLQSPKYATPQKERRKVLKIRSQRSSWEKSFVDPILAYRNRQAANFKTLTNDEYIFYFAIGSMINPISLHLRNIRPIVSYPATCYDHQIVFCGPNGMANIESRLGESFEGVVHLLTATDMNTLDKVEAVYNRIPVTVTDYSNQTQLAYAYQMDLSRLSNLEYSLPSERYMDIIIKGCEYYGVKQTYIDRLKQISVVPRMKSSEYKCITDVPDVHYTLDDLVLHNGTNNYPLWISINYKIFEHTGLPSTDDPSYHQLSTLYNVIKGLHSGKDMTLKMSQNLYEPLYGIPSTEDEMSLEHRSMVEDMFITFISNSRSGDKNYWRLIGKLIKSSSE